MALPGEVEFFPDDASVARRTKTRVDFGRPPGRWPRPR